MLARGHAVLRWGWLLTVCVLLIFPLKVSSIEPAFARWLPGICALALLVLGYIVPILRRVPRRDVEARYLLTDEGIEVASESRTLRVGWDTIRDVRASPSLLLLVVETDFVILVCRRWFPAEPAWAAMREAVSARLGKNRQA